MTQDVRGKLDIPVTQDVLDLKVGKNPRTQPNIMIHEFKKTHEISDIKDLICDFFTESDCNCAGWSVKFVFVFQVIKETLSAVQVQRERRGLLEIMGLQVMIQFWFCSRT